MFRLVWHSSCTGLPGGFAYGFGMAISGSGRVWGRLRRAGTIWLIRVHRVLVIRHGWRCMARSVWHGPERRTRLRIGSGESGRIAVGTVLSCLLMLQR